MRSGSGIFASRKVQKAAFSTLFGPGNRPFALKSPIYYCNTSDAEWQDTGNRQAWFDPLSSDDALKIKVKFPVVLPTIDHIKLTVKVSAYRHGHTPEWHDVSLDSDDRLSPDKREIWITTSMPSVPEKKGITFSSYESAGSANFNDSKDFESGMALSTDEKPSVPVRLGGNWTATEQIVPEGTIYPWSGAAVDLNLKRGGTAYIEVQGAGVPGAPFTAKRLLQEQSDWFYYSGHGLHDAETIGGGSHAADMEWHKGMNTVFIAGCSILDINNYNRRKHKDTGIVPTNSPGKAWSLTGPKHFLGYDWAAPLDNQDRDDFATANIILKCLGYIKSGIAPENAWMLANLHAKNLSGYNIATNACAISTPSGSGSRTYYYIRENTFRSNRIVTVTEANW